METKETTFTLRFSLTAEIPEALSEDDDFDEDQWLNEWEVAIKPGLIRACVLASPVLSQLEAHVRNRGVSPLEEIEVVVQHTFEVAGDPPKGTVQ